MMEETHECPQGDSRQVDQLDPQLKSYIQVAKVGVAIAIIKTAPQGVSGREYAQELCERFRRGQLNWKTKAEKLRLQVLSLQQQIFQLEHSGRSEDIQQESDVEYGQHDDSDQDHADASVSESACSALVPMWPSLVDQGGELEASLSGHVHFLQGVLRLRSWTVATAQGGDPGLASVSKQTVTEAISVVSRSVRNGSKDSALSGTILHHAVQTVAQFAESPAAQPIWTTVSEAVGHLLQDLLEVILTDSRLNQRKRDQTVRDLVLTIGTSSRLRHGVMLLLTRYVTEYSSVLRRVKRHQADFNPVAFEGIYHVLWCLEQLLRRERREPTGAAEGATVKLIQVQLEESLLHISTEFPLFAMYVWHIGGLVEELMANPP